ncbi:MAG: ASCH domain-containing protein [Candidatus Yonathbacteria bacterium]|nr:ASCH domain-containing protein [Candidatus Yonathbacteria bacterium]
MSMNKTLKFRQTLADMMLAGEKDTTWRLFDDKDISVGDVCDLLVSETREPFAIGTVTSVRETTFAALLPEDWDGHERYDTDEAMYAAYTDYYKQPVGPNTPLKIIKLDIELI